MMGKELMIAKRWTYKGRECVILLTTMNTYCAYVETNLVNVGYSQHEELSPESIISAHGGITFAGDLSIPESKPWYFGIDFAHYGDRISLPNGINVFEDGHAWTVEEVEKECERLADGVIRYEERYEEILKLKTRHEKEIAELKKQM